MRRRTHTPQRWLDWPKRLCGWSGELMRLRHTAENALKICRAGRWNRELASLKQPDSGRTHHDYFLRTFSNGAWGA